MGDGISPDFVFRDEGGRSVLIVTGDWTLATLAHLNKRLLERLKGRREWAEGGFWVDLSGLNRIDTAGAMLLDRVVRDETPDEGLAERMRGADPRIESMLRSVSAANGAVERAARRPFESGVGSMLEKLGRSAVQLWGEVIDTLAFIGEACMSVGHALVDWRRLRLTSTVSIAEEAGLDALPIVAFLSFFVGMVVAFIGATALADFGASIFVVELVGISVLREFGIIITAIILAGRTNSAFTAQIGAMKMRQEIDALQVTGLDPMDVLVVPRLLAMLIMVPVLAFVATVSGVAGGMVVAWAALDISPGFFLTRMLEGVPIQNLWVGLSKSPVVAMIVALIGCHQGLKVGHSVQSLGQSTTASVVHAIFAIIVMDAIFALFYMELDI